MFSVALICGDHETPYENMAAVEMSMNQPLHTLIFFYLINKTQLDTQDKKNGKNFTSHIVLSINIHIWNVFIHVWLCGLA